MIERQRDRVTNMQAKTWRRGKEKKGKFGMLWVNVVGIHLEIDKENDNNPIW